MGRISALLFVAASCALPATWAAYPEACAEDDEACAVGDQQSLIHLRQSTSAARVPTDIKGFYAWTWKDAMDPSGTNLRVCFNGYATVGKAMAAGQCRGATGDEEWISIGGNGNPSGIITADVLNAAAAAASSFTSAGYKGVIFDVEVVQGTNDALTQAFLSSSSALKAAGLKVGITSSHSGPFGVTGGADAATLVKTWVSDPSLSIISPQLYTSGFETAPETLTTSTCPDCTWDLFKGSIAAIVPSIVDASQYDAAAAFFAGQGITTAGYIQWAQTSGSSNSPVASGSTFCGTSWDDANSKCATACETDASCVALGETCFANLSGC